VAAVYEERDGKLYATELSRGPWDPGAQHGGAPAAVLMRAFEGVEGSLPIARVTYELLRPVPLGELSVSVSVLRPGRRVQLLEGVLVDPAGVEVVRARALRVACAEVSGGTRDVLEAGPDRGRPGDFRQSELKLFPVDAMEIRFTEGSFLTPGPAIAWFRLRVPLVAGEAPTGRQRLAAAADFPNGIASELGWEEWVFINPDLTLIVEREPIGEWVALDARMRVAPGSVGVAEAVLYDVQGRVGRSVQTLYIAARSSAPG